LRLHSYVIEHDYGFAPNPFHGVCTLATCKPRIREYAAIDDYIIGTGCAKRRRRGYLIYFMRVDKIMTFNDYWFDQRFECKRPNLRGSKMQAFGDNIYHTHPTTGLWLQTASFHSLKDGKPNPLNVDHDTKSVKVLIGSDFAYWGGAGPMIPERFRNFEGIDVCAKRGHLNRFPDKVVNAFVCWLRSLQTSGFRGAPFEWRRSA
jgi:hypothetical protein